nr:MAG TPA: hypothetical protein [Caudoviricetes sp.]
MPTLNLLRFLQGCYSTTRCNYNLCSLLVFSLYGYSYPAKVKAA